MGKCLRKCLCLPNKKNDLKTFNILILGLSGVGKTEIGHIIIGEQRKDYSNTNGVRKFTKKFDETNCLWNLTEIGGSADMQKIWHHYFIKAIAIIYIIDMSDLMKISDGFNTLRIIVKNQYIRGKPILVVVNKADLTTDIDLNELEEIFCLESLANTFKSPMLLIENHMFDITNFVNGLNWLQGKLLLEYRNLINRVKFDSDLVRNHKFKNPLKTIENNSSRPSTAPSRLNKITQHNKFKNIRLRRIHAKENLPNNINSNNDDNNDKITNKMDNIIINPALPTTSLKTTITLNNNSNINLKTNVAIVTIETIENDDEENYDKYKNNNENGFYKNTITTYTTNKNNGNILKEVKE